MHGCLQQETLTDDLAKSLTNEALAIDQDELTLRKTYAAKLGPVLSGKKVASLHSDRKQDSSGDPL